MSEQDYYKSQKDVKALEDRITELEATIKRVDEQTDKWMDDWPSFALRIKTLLEKK